MNMYETYGIYKIYLKVDNADVEIIDITEEGVAYKSINNRLVDQQQLLLNVNGVIDEYMSRDIIYKVI